MTRPHVAVLDEELPFPLTSGKRIRTFNLLARLSGEHRITLIAHRQCDPGEQKIAEQAMTNAGITVRVVDRSVPAKSGIGFYARLFANQFSPLPYSVATHASSAMAGEVARLAREDRPDLWHAEWTPYARLLAGRAEPWVIMAHNVESLIWQRSAEVETNALKRWVLREQWRKFERFETWACQSATRTSAVSREAARLMARLFGVADADVVDNGVDTRLFQPAPARDRDPIKALFLGSLDWRPNLDGVRWMLEQIWPLVRDQEPNAVFQVVGRKPPRDLRTLIERTPGVELHADVPDVRPFLEQAGMMVVPLRIGGGSRLKILEALATALPVVTTHVGVEGLRLRNQEHLSIADEPEAFAESMLDTIAYHQLACRMAARGRMTVEREYDWDALAARLGRIWNECAGGSLSGVTIGNETGVAQS